MKKIILKNHIFIQFEIKISFKIKCKIWLNLYTLKKFLAIHEKLRQKMWCIENIIGIFSNILQKISSQKFFLMIKWKWPQKKL
jgi:hypothetical protein